MSPFDVTNKILGPYLFSATARETLGDKIELYFHDHAFVPLFIQENYLKTQPSRVRNDNGPEKDLKLLDLMDKAASSISDGDLVDALIHGYILFKNICFKPNQCKSVPNNIGV
jgi:replication factor C subunit 1